MLSAEQLALRRTGLTATDLTKLAMVSPYGGPQDVLNDKRGVPSPFDETDRVKWGNLLEDPIRQDYAQRHGVTVLHPNGLGTLRHPDIEWAMATPDGVVTDRPSDWGAPRWLYGWECKTHTNWLADTYGEQGTDEVPPHELVQCAWNMMVADLDRWDLTAFMDGVPRDFTIRRDPELEAMLVEIGAKFWEENVLRGNDLEPDGSKHYTAHLARMFPSHKGEDLIVAPHGSSLAGVIGSLHDIRGQIRELEGEEERYVQIIKEAIGEASGVKFASLTDGVVEQKITWRKAKDGSRTDWKAVAQARLNELEIIASGILGTTSRAKLRKLAKNLDRAAAQHVETNTVQTTGSRRFNVPRKWR